MTARQAKMAATLIAAIYNSQGDTPGEIDGVADEDVSKIVAAINAHGRATLNRLDYSGKLTKEAAVQFAIDNY